MAVDYVHRLVASGRAEAVRRLSRALYREYPRSIGGQTWTEIVPFSFEALYQLAPRAVRIEAEIPADPYELSAWPVRKLRNGDAEARYQFQTRNLEIAGLIRALARTLPQVTFTLVTFCLDNAGFESYRFAAGRQTKWFLPQRRIDFHWERARRKFGPSGDDIYEDDDARHWAEEQMLDEALAHWNETGGRGARPRRYNWWNQPLLRDLATERELALYAIADSIEAETRRKRRRTTRHKRKP